MRIMKNSVKLLVLASVILMLAVSVSGCVTSDTPTATPQATTTPTTPTQEPIATPVVATPVATATPKPTVPTVKPASTAIDSDIQAVVTGMENKGYAVTTPLRYSKTDSSGNRWFTVTFLKGNYQFVTTIIKTGTSGTGQTVYGQLVSTAQTSGFTGTESSLSGYDAWWQGTRYSPTTLCGVGLIEGGDYVIQMVETVA